MQKYGAIEKFDLLFHKSGPLAGQPRGYAFVTYESKEDAQKMKTDLDGKKLGTKCLTIKWAHSMDKIEVPKPKVPAVIPALGVKVEQKLSPSLQIKAIEAKLNMMKHTADEEFRISNAPSTSSAIALSCHRKPSVKGVPTQKNKFFHRHPYSKK